MTQAGKETQIKVQDEGEENEHRWKIRFKVQVTQGRDNERKGTESTRWLRVWEESYGWEAKDERGDSDNPEKATECEKNWEWVSDGKSGAGRVTAQGGRTGRKSGYLSALPHSWSVRTFHFLSTHVCELQVGDVPSYVWCADLYHSRNMIKTFIYQMCPNLNSKNTQEQ